MKSYDLIDWTLAETTPHRHTYHLDWKKSIGGPIASAIVGVSLLGGIYWLGLESPMTVLFWPVAVASGVVTVYLSYRALRRRVIIEADGKGQLTLRQARVVPDVDRWSVEDVAKISFGVREAFRTQQSASPERGWFWHVDVVHHVTKSMDNGKETIVRPAQEFVVAVQSDSPSRERAVIPVQVKELVHWLERTTGKRARGPILSSNSAWQPEQAEPESTDS